MHVNKKRHFENEHVNNTCPSGHSMCYKIYTFDVSIIKGKTVKDPENRNLAPFCPTCKKFFLEVRKDA